MGKVVAVLPEKIHLRLIREREGRDQFEEGSEEKESANDVGVRPRTCRRRAERGGGGKGEKSPPYVDGKK